MQGSRAKTRRTSFKGLAPPIPPILLTPGLGMRDSLRSSMGKVKELKSSAVAQSLAAVKEVRYNNLFMFMSC